MQCANIYKDSNDFGYLFPRELFDFLILLGSKTKFYLSLRPPIRSVGRVARQRSAKPRTAVRIRHRPQKIKDLSDLLSDLERSFLLGVRQNSLMKFNLPYFSRFDLSSIRLLDNIFPLLLRLNIRK